MLLKECEDILWAFWIELELFCSEETESNISITPITFTTTETITSEIAYFDIQSYFLADPCSSLARMNATFTFNGIIYECSFLIELNSVNSNYRCNNDNWSMRYDDIINFGDYNIIIMLDNLSEDSDVHQGCCLSRGNAGKLIVDKIKVRLENNIFYRIDQLCIDNAAAGTWYHNLPKTNTEICKENQIHTYNLCINKWTEECASVMQASQLDMNQPNRYIKNASWHSSKYNLNRYFFYPVELLNFRDAEQYCQDTYTTSLGSIHGPRENRAAYQACIGDQTSCWIGLERFSNSSSNFTWHWTDGTDMDFTNWISGCSVEDDSSHLCARIDHNGMWITADCNNEYYILCNIYPTYNRTTDHSNAPSNAPSSTPTTAHSLAPSLAPSVAPSNSPSLSPSTSPSNASSFAPTRYPTQSNAYDSYMDVAYNISIVSPRYIDYLANDFKNKTIDIVELTERGCSDHQGYINKQTYHEYRTFTLKILNISDENIDKLANDNGLKTLLRYFPETGGLIFNSTLECSSFICNEIYNKYDVNQFEQKTSALLTAYFQDNTQTTNANEVLTANGVIFTVLSMGNVQKYTAEEPPEMPYSWITGSIGCTLLLLVLWCLVYYYDVIRKEITKRNTIFIRNPMVISLAIGFYKSKPTAMDIKNIGGRIKDLEGVRIDIRNAINLFGNDSLKYEVYPTRYYKQNIDNYKASWDEKEIIDFLTKKSEDLEEN